MIEVRQNDRTHARFGNLQDAVTYAADMSRAATLVTVHVPGKKKPIRFERGSRVTAASL
jgi:hypothetical protein